MIKMKILFINGSPNKDGNTVSLAKTLLKSKDYETLNLVDYKIYSYGQNFKDDQFSYVIDKIKNADIIVIGSPLYWHSMSGAIRNLLDRSYGYVHEGEFSGKDLYFIFQGAAPPEEQLKNGEYTIKRYAELYGMNYISMASNQKEAQVLAEKI